MAKLRVPSPKDSISVLGENLSKLSIITKDFPEFFLIKNKRNPRTIVAPLNNKTRLKPCHILRYKSVGVLLIESNDRLRIPLSANIGKNPNNKVKKLKITTGTHKKALGFSIDRKSVV